eukprot:scaffold19018_cov19-Tisochrysis_lutea.AAC.1
MPALCSHLPSETASLHTQSGNEGLQGLTDPLQPSQGHAPRHSCHGTKQSPVSSSLAGSSLSRSGVSAPGTTLVGCDNKLGGAISSSLNSSSSRIEGARTTCTAFPVFAAAFAALFTATFAAPAAAAAASAAPVGAASATTISTSSAALAAAAPAWWSANLPALITSIGVCKWTALVASKLACPHHFYMWGEVVGCQWACAYNKVGSVGAISRDGWDR